MKTIPLTSAGLLLASLIATSPLHAATVTWTGGASGDWINAVNWSGGVLPGASDDAFFDTTGSDINVVVPNDTFNLGTKLHITGSGGTVSFTQGGTSNLQKFTLTNGFLAEGNVSMVMDGTSRLYPGATGGAVTSVWNSTGTLTTDPSDTLGLFFNTVGSTFVIQQGLVEVNGTQLFGQKGNTFIDLQGGALNSSNLFTSGAGQTSSAINLNGGNINQSGNMTWNCDASINLAAGLFTVAGDVAFGTTAGELNFTNGSIGSFVSDHTEGELLALIGNGDITKDAGDSRTFLITDNGSNRTLSLVPEPSSTALLGLGGVALILRRRK